MTKDELKELCEKTINTYAVAAKQFAETSLEEKCTSIYRGDFKRYEDFIMETCIKLANECLKLLEDNDDRPEYDLLGGGDRD